MSVTMVRQKVKAGSVEDAEAAVRGWFAALDRERPEGLRYASTRVDGSTFVILTELADGSEDPRQAIPEFQRFLEQLRGWVDGAGDRAPRRRGPPTPRDCWSDAHIEGYPAGLNRLKDERRGFRRSPSLPGVADVERDAILAL
jgi:hypothetical protein